MKKINYWLLASLFVGSFALAACGNDDENTPNGGDNTNIATEDNVDYSKTGGSGSVTLKTGQQIAELNIPKYAKGDLGGIELSDDELKFSYYNSEETDSAYKYEGFNLVISDYSESKTTFNGVNVSFSCGSGNDYYQGNSSYWNNGVEIPSQVSATVTKQSDGSYKIRVQGDMYLSGRKNENNIDSNGTPNATINVEVVAPVVATMTLHRKVSSKQSYFPADTPWLDGKTVDGALEIKSPVLGNGVLLWYYGNTTYDAATGSQSNDLNYAQYENLKAQAVKAMGEPFECWDATTAAADTTNGYQPMQNGVWGDMAYAYFYKDKKYVMVSYCPWRYESGDEGAMPWGLEALRENHAARLQVHVLENMNIDYKQLVFSHH